MTLVQRMTTGIVVEMEMVWDVWMLKYDDGVVFSFYHPRDLQRRRRRWMLPRWSMRMMP
jgi:hypothetical protein